MKLIMAMILLCALHSGLHASSYDKTSFKQSSHHITCEGGRFDYLLYAPEAGEKAEPHPAIMVLHGAGDHPDSFIEAFKSFARKENVVIIAPELPRKMEFEAVAPQVFRCMVKETATLTPLDPNRIYLLEIGRAH